MEPLVTVVIPVGPRHRDVARQAVASCTYQTYAGWRAVLVNDSGAPLPRFADRRVSIIDGGRALPGQSKPAVARNVGLAAVTTSFVVFLDADDYLLPDALNLFLRGHAQHDAAYTFSQWYATSNDGNRVSRNHCAYGYQQQRYAQFNLHPITALLPTDAVRAVGGFDEAAPGFEDWTLYLRLAMAGYCGQPIYQPTFVYRIHFGAQHHDDAAHAQAIMDQIIAAYKGDDQEIRFMGCGCGGAAGRAKQAAQQAVKRMTLPEIQMMSKDGITVEYTGKQQGTITVPGGNGRKYRVSATPSRRYLTTKSGQLHPDDVQLLVSTGRFRVVAPAPVYQPPPNPAAVLPDIPTVEGTQTTMGQADEETDQLTDPDEQGVAEATPSRRRRAKKDANLDGD